MGLERTVTPGTSKISSSTLARRTHTDTFTLDDRKTEEVWRNSKQRGKPGLSYIALISMAIQSAPDQKMLLSEIYQWISARFPFFRVEDNSWRNSVRHNLSLNECFVKSGRSKTGKGNYWSIHPANMEDFSNGDYRRRRARRLVRKCDEELKNLCFKTSHVETVPQLSQCNEFVPMKRTVVPSDFIAKTIGYQRMSPLADRHSMQNACEVFEQNQTFNTSNNVLSGESNGNGNFLQACSAKATTQNTVACDVGEQHVDQPEQ